MWAQCVTVSRQSGLTTGTLTFQSRFGQRQQSDTLSDPLSLSPPPSPLMVALSLSLSLSLIKTWSLSDFLSAGFFKYELSKGFHSN